MRALFKVILGLIHLDHGARISHSDRFFSWSEMEVLGRQPGLQRELVDRLLIGVAIPAEQRDSIDEQLVANREAIDDSVGALNAARAADSGLLGRYRQYRDAYTAINTPAVAALFKDLDAARARRELLGAVDEELEELEGEIESIVERQLDTSIGALVDEADADTQAWWKQVESQLKIGDLDTSVKGSAASALQEIRERRKTVVDLHAAVTTEIERVEQDLRTKARIDKEQELLPDQRELARERFEAADTARVSYLALLSQLDEALGHRTRLLADLTKAQDEISAARERELAPLNEGLAAVGGDGLDISVDRQDLADREAVEIFLNEHILTQERAGRYLQKRVARRLCNMGRPAALSSALVEGDVEALGSETPVGHSGALKPEEAAKLLEGCSWRTKDEDAEVDIVDDTVIALLELGEQPIEDRVSIRLNDRAVDELSPGQRSSAMLPLIALAEKGPLIIDQPEDNLDNAMVGATLTRLLADLKEQRQIIVSTHNPNIVVGGDAEQVVVLNAEDGHRAAISTTGSIDDEAVIDAVLTVMEGGRAAFETRRKRYGVE